LFRLGLRSVVNAYARGVPRRLVLSAAGGSADLRRNSPVFAFNQSAQRNAPALTTDCALWATHRSCAAEACRL